MMSGRVAIPYPTRSTSGPARVQFSRIAIKRNYLELCGRPLPPPAQPPAALREINYGSQLFNTVRAVAFLLQPKTAGGGRPGVAGRPQRIF